MFKKYMLALTLFVSTQSTQTHDNTWSHVQRACILAGVTVAGALTYKTYTQWLVKRAQAHFMHERNILNQYAIYSAETHTWSTHDAAYLLRDLKTAIVYLHNNNRNRWDIGVMYDIYFNQPAMYVEYRYRNFPLIQHMQDISWYLKHLKIIRFFNLHADTQEITLLIEQLTYIRQMILGDHNYSLEEAQYQATRWR
jgi:hypothetical protein